MPDDDGGHDDDETDPLTGLLQEFEKGVNKQLPGWNWEARYNLGVAYIEMGLLDQAIAEFEAVASEIGALPKHETIRFDCPRMLGNCYLEKGMPCRAVEWFERCLDAAPPTEQEHSGALSTLAIARAACDGQEES